MCDYKNRYYNIVEKIYNTKLAKYITDKKTSRMIKKIDDRLDKLETIHSIPTTDIEDTTTCSNLTISDTISCSDTTSDICETTSDICENNSSTSDICENTCTISDACDNLTLQHLNALIIKENNKIKVIKQTLNNKTIVEINNVITSNITEYIWILRDIVKDLSNVDIIKISDSYYNVELNGNIYELGVVLTDLSKSNVISKLNKIIDNNNTFCLVYK